MSSAAAPHVSFMARLLATRLKADAVVDVGIAVTVFVVSLGLLSRHVGSLQTEQGQLNPVSGVLIACSTLPLVMWRRAPHAVFILTALASALLAALGYSIGLPVGPTIALYLLAESRDDTHPWTRNTTATVLLLFAAYIGATALGARGVPGSELFHTSLAWAVAWFAGERTRLRRERFAELSRRAVRADHEVERERRLAQAEERARIARDLHDSVGHAINVIAVRAGAARLRYDQDPERSRAALEAIEEVARQTAGEIDQIVGMLRDGEPRGGEMAVPPGLASLPRLVAHHSAGGLEVTVTTAGSPRALSGPVDLAAYRILQEALTNAARHGSGVARVELAFDDAALGLTVINPVPAGSQSRTNGGHGVTGMRERASVLGGSLEADRVNGSFRVLARLPYRDRVP
jgi:signal transduction histidine kinase